MLDDESIPYQYREYKKEPLTEQEWKDVLRKLNVPARELLRKRDKAYKTLGLSGSESNEQLLPHFAKHPTLVQRPIFIHGNRAVVGRPVERMMDIIEV